MVMAVRIYFETLKQPGVNCDAEGAGKRRRGGTL